LDRADAIALLKELVSLHLVQPSLIMVKKNADGSSSLVIKVNGNIQSVRQFVAEKNLAMEENQKTGYFIIFEP